MHQGKGWQLNRRSSVLWSAILIAVLLIGVLFYMLAYKPEASGNYLLSIDDVEVTEEEFLMFLQDEKANVANHFFTTYGAQYSESFWETEYEGEVPIEMAKERVLDRLTRIKAEQKLAVQYKVLPDTNFNGILKLATGDSKSSYGAESLNAFQSYLIYHSKALLAAKDKYKLDAAAVTEAEKQRFYEENLNEQYKAADEVEALVIQLSQADQEKAQQTVVDNMSGLVAQLQGGADVRSVLQSYPYIADMSVKQYGSSEGKDENSSALDTELKKLAYTLNADEMLGPVEIDGTPYIIVCLNRLEGRSASYGEVKELIEDTLLEQKFEKLVDEMTAKANVVIHEKQVYQQIAMK